jgi:hypothetical protein
MLLRVEVLSALALTVGVGLAAHSSIDGPTQVGVTMVTSHAEVSFTQQVLPILEKHCWECHSEVSTELGLRLDTYEGAMAGSDYGTVIEAGDPDGSLLVDMIVSGDMPEDGDPVPSADLEVIKTWIAEGAKNN